MAAAGAVRTSPRSPRGLRAPAPAGRPNLRLVGAPRHGSRYALAALLFAGVSVFGVVGLHALAAEQSFEARALEDEVQELSLRYDELTAEIAGLEAPERVRQVALGQLGMVPAEHPGFIVANQDGRGDEDSDLGHGTLREPRATDGVADPVKHVLAAGR